MAKHVLSLDLDDEPLTIIALHSDEEDYRFVYWLNQRLNLRLQREAEDLEFVNHIFAPWYVFENELEFTRFVLLPNKIERDTADQEIDLFSGGFKQVYYVLPELKKANFLLKIEGASAKDLTEILNKLKGLPEIVMAYALNSQQIKSRTNLIF
jgi:hypothetical protein